MDKLKAAHISQKEPWRTARGVKKQKPKGFATKLKRILRQTLYTSGGEETVNKKVKEHTPLSFDSYTRKVLTAKDVEVVDKSNEVRQRKKDKRKSDLNCNTLVTLNMSGAHAGSVIGCGSLQRGTHKKKKRKMDQDQKQEDSTDFLKYTKSWKKGSSSNDQNTDSCIKKKKRNSISDLVARDRKSVNDYKHGETLKQTSFIRFRKSVKKGSTNDDREEENIEKQKDSDSPVDCETVKDDKQAEMQKRAIGPDITDFLMYKSQTEEENIKGGKSGTGKKKKVGSKTAKLKSPLVVEMKISDMKPPRLLQQIGEDKGDDMELALQEFYSSLDTAEVSTGDGGAEISTASGVVYTTVKQCVSETRNDYESETWQLQESEGSWTSYYYNSEMDYVEESEYSGYYNTTEAESSQYLSYSYTNEAEPSECDSSIPVLTYKLPHRQQFLMLMKHPNKLFFKGNLTITVLMGNVEVLGFSMSREVNSRQTVYSPKGSSMLSIDTCRSAPPSSLDYEVMAETLTDQGLHLSKSMIADVEQRDCVLLLESPPPSPLEGYLKILPPHMQLFTFVVTRDSTPLKETARELSCVFELPNTSQRLKRYAKAPEWDTIAGFLKQEPTCAVVCGGKGVGKSTFLRFLINQCLPLYGEVICLDFDPGQAEFTVPGCVSATVVKQPLLGPNFTHLTRPDCMVNIGEVNVSQCPHQYIDSVQYVVDFCNARPDFKGLPWIVNTMGFNKGVGVDLTTSVIRMLRPYHVIQIKSRNKDYNFPELLDSSYVYHYQSRFYKNPSGPLHYSIHEINSMAEERRAESPWGMGAAQLREAMIVSYLSQMVKEPNYVLADNIPYITSFSKVTLCVCHAKVPYSQILSAMNGNLVALCIYDGDDALVPDDPELPAVLGHQPVCPCIGFGVVRGVDIEKKQIFIITPVSDAEMSEVNLLMMGTVSLPGYVYIRASGCDGKVPYVVTGPCQPMGTVAHRFFRPLKFVKGSNKNT